MIRACDPLAFPLRPAIKPLLYIWRGGGYVRLTPGFDAAEAKSNGYQNTKDSKDSTKDVDVLVLQPSGEATCPL